MMEDEMNDFFYGWMGNIWHSGGLARYFSLILFYYLLPPCITYTT